MINANLPLTCQGRRFFPHQQLQHERTDAIISAEILSEAWPYRAQDICECRSYIGTILLSGSPVALTQKEVQGTNSCQEVRKQGLNKQIDANSSCQAAVVT